MSRVNLNNYLTTQQINNTTSVQSRKPSKLLALALSCLLLSPALAQPAKELMGSRFQQLTLKYCGEHIPQENCLTNSQFNTVTCAQLSPEWITAPSYYQTNQIEETLICPDARRFVGTYNSTHPTLKEFINHFVDCKIKGVETGPGVAYIVRKLKYETMDGKKFETREGLENSVVYEIKEETKMDKVYVGNWEKNGRMHGFGILKGFKGHSWDFEGLFKNGKMVNGKTPTVNGSFFKGQFENSLPKEGVLIKDENIIFKGLFKKKSNNNSGTIISLPDYGTFFTDETGYFEGRFENGIPIGKYYDNTGNLIYEGDPEELKEKLKFGVAEISLFAGFVFGSFLTWKRQNVKAAWKKLKISWKKLRNYCTAAKVSSLPSSNIKTRPIKVTSKEGAQAASSTSVPIPAVLAQRKQELADESTQRLLALQNRDNKKAEEDANMSQERRSLHKQRQARRSAV